MECEYRLEQSLLGHQKGVRCITNIQDFTNLNAKFASGGDMGEVIIWKLTEIAFEPHLQFIPHTNTVMCLTSTIDSFTNSTVLFSGGRDAVIVKSTLQGEALLRFTGHSGPVCFLNLVAEKGFLLSGSWDGSAIIWNLESSAINYKLDGFQYGVYPAYSLNSGYIYLGTQNGHITVWNGKDRVGVDAKAHKDAIRTVRVYNELILTSSNDGTVKVCNLKFGEKREFCGHSSFVYDAHITLDGSRLISSSEDCTVIVWDLDSVKSIQIIPHPSTVWQAVSFGNRLITACQDGRVRVYNNDPDFIPDSSLEVFDANPADSSIAENATNGKKPYYSGDSQFPSGNYDYIFQVELDGKYYSLPYNCVENPASVAERFCKNAGISTNSVPTISDFIIKNVPKIGLPIISVPQPITFSDVSKDKMLDKITEFNHLVPDDLKLTLIELDSVKYCLSSDNTVDTYILSKMYQWPKDQMLPILDLLRILPLKSGFSITSDFVKLLITTIESNDSEIMVSLALKTICNSLYLTIPKMKMENYMPQLCNILLTTAKTATLRIQQPLSVITLNYSHMLISKYHSEQRKILLKLIVECLQSCKLHLENWGLSVSGRFIMSIYKLYSLDPKICSNCNTVGEVLLTISQSSHSLIAEVKEALSVLTNSIYN